ncbi:MAG: hemerythrin family protein, partial [Geopsychrobacter sp.]|nr:hemerythrin family protein [Geopsychrobacter sp.]
MHVFCWDQNFETGLPEVDKQHRQLVDIVNQFGDLLAQNKLKSGDLTELFSKLITYTERHFQEEEKLMVSHAIDKRHRDRHIKEHEDFLQEIVFMQKEINFLQQEQGLNDDDPGQTLFEFLNNWLAYHLLGSDKCLSLQIAAIEAGKSAEQAYEIETREINKSTGSLLTALNNLFRQISNRNRQLIEMNQTLEQKVAERTQELAEANSNRE